MENPFKTLLVNEKPSNGPEVVDKEEAIKKLLEWRDQVKAGMEMQTTRQDAEQLDKIHEQIRRIKESQ